MQGREFLELARDLLTTGSSSRHWRGVMIHVYYALLLECRETMTGWGLPPPARHQLHFEVRRRLTSSSSRDLKDVGHVLEQRGIDRNAANYDLRDLPAFASPVLAQKALKLVAAALAQLDAIDADPARRTAAIASIKP